MHLRGEVVVRAHNNRREKPRDTLRHLERERIVEQGVQSAHRDDWGEVSRLESWHVVGPYGGDQEGAVV